MLYSIHDLVIVNNLDKLRTLQFYARKREKNLRARKLEAVKFYLSKHVRRKRFR